MLQIDLSNVPVFKTERLVLRQVLPNDAEQMHILRSDDSTMKFLDRPRSKSVEDAHALIKKMDEAQKNNEGITWTITIIGDDRLIGTIGIWRIDKENHRGEIGYMIFPDHWKKGIMTEATTAVLKFGFEKLNLHSIEANLNPENIASVKLIEKLGFRKEAHFTENYFFEGKFLDSLIYSKLNPDHA
jgi:[ribosomal protein S5]-alanine N-acetyltransferase